MSFVSRKVIIVGAIIAIAAIGLFAVTRFLFFRTDDVEFSLRGPSTVNIGEKHELYAVITNRSNAALQDVRISFTYPNGTESPDDPGVRVKEANVTKLEPGEKKTFPFSIVVRGFPNQDVKPTATASFRTQAISLRFNKEAQWAMRVIDLPVDVNLVLPENPAPGREFTFLMKWESRAEVSLSDIGFFLETPADFDFISSTPLPSPFNERLWDLGVVNPQATGEIAVKGIFSPGSLGGDFTVRVGKLNDDHSNVTVVFKEESTTVRPTISSLLISQRVQGNLNPQITNIDPGQDFSLVLLLTNTTNTIIKDVKLIVELPDKYFEFNTLHATEDPVQRDSEKWIFDGSTVLDLRAINPGAQKEIRFGGTILFDPPFNTINDRNPEFDIRASAETGGLRLGDSQSLVKLNGKLYINQDILYYNAPGGQNSGPVPPRVGQETTYTVIWDAFTGTSGMKDVVARAVLGPAVEFVAVLFPTDAVLDWNPSTREVRWNIGDLPAGIGVKTEPREISFRIKVTPRMQDVGKFATLISSVKLTGQDVFTDVMREYELNEATTALPKDTAASGPVEP